jgi:hypothetical protein
VPLGERLLIEQHALGTVAPEYPAHNDADNAFRRLQVDVATASR